MSSYLILTFYKSETKSTNTHAHTCVKVELLVFYIILSESELLLGLINKVDEFVSFETFLYLNNHIVSL